MATEVVTAEGAAAQASPEIAPYGPSWLDVIVRAIDRAPGPTWLAYLVIGAALLLFVNIEGWLAGAGLDEFDPAQSVYAFFFLTPLVLYHYLSNVAGEASDRFRSATDLDDEEQRTLRYRLTVTPPGAALVVGALAVAMNLAWVTADPAGFQLTDRAPIYVAVRLVTESLLSAMVFVLILQIVRQLVIIAGLHRAATRVDLLRPAPLHAFARLTSRSAIGVIVFAVLTGLPLPGVPESTWLTTVFFWSVPMIILGGLVFFLPLRGMNSRLVEEKGRLMTETALHIERATAALHRVVDTEASNSNDGEASRAAQTRIDALTKALAGLLQEREFIKKQSTWPWDSSTMRAVVSALALPILLFLITRFLDRLI